MNRSKVIALMVVLVSVCAFAQTENVTAKPLTDSDIQLLRQDAQAAKDAIIKDSMKFNDTEAAAFWPLYKQYAGEQQAIGKKRLQLMTDYAQSLDNLTDAKAKSLTAQYFAIEGETLALRKTYFPRFTNAIGARRAAQFYQIDNRLALIINLQLTSMVPLIP